MNLRIVSCSLAVSAAFAGMMPLNAVAAPSVAFKTPTSGATISGNIYQSKACEVTGSNIDRVRFYLDSTTLNTEESSPWNCNVDTTKFADGAHTLRAVAYDRSGASRSTQISVNIKNSTTSTNTPPTVSFKAPLSGATVSGSLSGSACEAAASDANGIKQVQFFMDGTALNTELSVPYNCTLDTSKFADGAHVLKAVATDGAGASSSAQVSLTVKNGTQSPTNVAPTVSITAPAEGAKISGSAVTFDAAASDSDGSITKVEFLLGTTLLASDTTNSYHTTIDTTKYANGSYTLIARATDNAGAVTTAQRSVTIENLTSSPTSGPTVAWKAPAEGGTLSGNVQGPPNCVVDGANIAKVMFYLNGTWTNTDGNLDNGLGCWIDTTKYPDGAYTVKAVAYDAAGKTASAERGIVIKNGTATSGAPTVSFKQPASGGTLSGTLQDSAACEVTGSNIAKVQFSLDGTALNTELSSPWHCSFDTTKFANGSHTLMATAYNSAGAAASSQVSININNSTTSTPPPSTATIDAADIIGQAPAEVPFAQQSGYSGQVLGQYPAASSIPETGINGTVLSNGETVRLGKQADPLDSIRKALVFQLAPSDPDTSGSKRTEISFGKNVEHGKVYWVALSAYVYDWGTLASDDTAIFGTQLHSGDNSRGLSPSFSIVTRGGPTFYVTVRHSTSTSPTQSNTVTYKYPEKPIAFGRWMDFVFKFKESISGDGFLQMWQDGTQIVDYAGNLGFNTPGYNDYMKFGYYNWSSAFNSSRKVLLRSPLIVADPTGAKYKAEDLRNHVRSN